MERKIKEAKKKGESVAPGSDREVVTLLSEISGLLRSMNSHLKSLAYYQGPSRGFEAGIEQAIAQPFISEVSDSDIKSLVREELKNLGDK